MLAAPSASAILPPSGGNDCPAGYAVAYANKSYTVALVRGSTTTQDAVAFEINGYGCFRRSGNTGFMRFKWDAPGKVSGALFFYQIYDCTLGRAAGSWSLGYPTTSATNFGVAANRSLALNPTHRYAGQIMGSGSYVRTGRVDFQGLLGYFQGSSMANAGVPRWFGRTACF